MAAYFKNTGDYIFYDANNSLQNDLEKVKKDLIYKCQQRIDIKYSSLLVNFSIQ